ncbi:hypothetical protein ABID23_000572 [Bartonella silvatica]|uniref:Uncharacterized protein n=1 Tax=Bartonella silvatica TaxID=357760 RepID=A0ABV2HG33_9HYPH
MYLYNISLDVIKSVERAETKIRDRAGGLPQKQKIKGML